MTITVGTVATTPWTSAGTSNDVNVVITAATQALLVLVPTSSAADDITLTLDPGGGDEIVIGPEVGEFLLRHNYAGAESWSGNIRAALFTALPAPATYTFRITDTSGSRRGCVVFPLESSSDLAFVQSATNSADAAGSIAATFAAPAGNGSFVAAVAVAGFTAGVAYTWTTLDEEFDAEQSGESASVAGRVDPTEQSGYTATFSETVTAAIGVAIEIAEVAGDRVVAAGTEQLTAAAQASTVNRQRGVSAGTVSLAASAPAATVARSRGVAATTESLSIAPQAAAVSRSRTVVAGTQALSIAPQQALVNRTREVAAIAEELGITGHQATVTRGTLVSIVGATASVVRLNNYSATVTDISGKKATIQ